MAKKLANCNLIVAQKRLVISTAAGVIGVTHKTQQGKIWADKNWQSNKIKFCCGTLANAEALVLELAKLPNVQKTYVDSYYRAAIVLFSISKAEAAQRKAARMAKQATRNA